MEIPQLNDHPLPFWQAGNRLPQSDFLHHPFFRFRVRQNVFQREAFVPRFSLNRLRGGGGRFGQGDFFRGKPGLTGNFLNRRFPAQRPGQTAAGGLDGRGLLFQAPGHLYRPVVPEEPPDLPGDFRHGVGGKLGSVGKVEPLHGLEKAKAPQLVQIVRFRSPA